MNSRVKYIATGFLLCAFLSVPLEEAAAAPTYLRAEGMALKQDDESGAPNRALMDALKNIIQNYVDEFNEGASFDVPPDVVKSITSGDIGKYVLNYRIITKGWLTHIEAVPDEPAQDDATQDDANLTDDMGDGEDYEGTDYRPPYVGNEYYHMTVEANVNVDLIKKEMREAAGVKEVEPVDVSLVLLDIGDSVTYDALRSFLSEIDMIKELSSKSFRPGRFVLKAKVEGNAHMLWEKLNASLGDKFVVLPSGPQRLIIKNIGGAITD